MVTRAKAGIFKPLERMNCHVTTTSPLPRSHIQALRDPIWKKSMLDEYNALITNGTWVLVPCSANVNVVRSMWLFKHKFHANGSLNSLAVSRDLPIHQLDVKNAFLHGHLSDMSKFAKEILERVKNCNSCRTPVDTESKLGPDSDPVTDSTLYRSLAGAL
ncbi:ribonuclease H-like domain-containing protein [Tanacetum coccineum]